MKVLFDENLSFFADNRRICFRVRATCACLAALLGQLPKVIRFRCGNQATKVVESLLRNHAGLIVDFGHDDSACLEIY